MNKRLPLIFIMGGSILFLVGLLFKTLKWPDMFYGFYSGPVLITFGLLVFLIEKQNGKSDNS
jgi:hypothetical protein